MTKLHAQRAIIDRRALILRLAEVAQSDLPKMKRRGKVLETFKEALNSGRAEVRRRFDERGHGAETVRENCFLIDQLVRAVHDFAAEHEFPQGIRTAAEALSLVAVGGYGRGELSPQSDIDLLFLTPYKRTPFHEQIVEFVLYMLWDMGLKVGHATRSADECVRLGKGDLTIRTALLEMRWIWGDQPLFFDLQERFRTEIIAGSGEEFVEAKLAERDSRHTQMGDTRYVLEPNVKEGKGGLRDLHTLYWLAKYLYRVKDIGELVDMGVLSKEARRRFDKAQGFLWTVRCHLHYLTGRPEDRLTFDVQPEIAARMGYGDRAGSRGVERFMKHFFLVAKDVGDLTRLFCALAEEQQKRKPRLHLGRLLFLKRSRIEGFELDGDRLTVAAADQFQKEPVAMIRLFHAALESGVDIHPKALDLIHRNLKRIDAHLRDDPAANRLFMDILTSRRNPAVALRHMNEAGVLGRFIPDFGRVVAQMQYDMYHVYTVDEHTQHAIGILHAIEAGELKEEAPVATEIIHKVGSRRALYTAVLLHDIAKGRNGDHSVLGAEVAMKLGPRLGLSDAETETVAWLVREHLTMSRIAFKRDIYDPQTIADFVAVVQSPERLRLLLCLTVADIRAVGPTVWNGWKAGLLRELYLRAEEVMLGGLADGGRAHRVAAAQAALRTELAATGWPEADIEAHLARGYPNYWTSSDTATQLRHARLVREAEGSGAPLTVDSHVDRFRSVTEITVYTSDHPGLFSQIAGAMAVSGANIVDAKIVTLANGMALDTFWIQENDGGAFDSPAKLAKLSAAIEQVLSGRMRLDRELAARKGKLPSRASVFKVPPRVLVDNKASSTHTLIEVNGRDRPGLLYDLTAAMTRLGLQIHSAHISTYGERVVDVFYLKDVFGLKVEHGRKLDQVKDALMKALEDPAAPAKAAE
ncbi:[protein-PII] uridylyltransferase [Magnetospirillum sp. UT-4]|uniref:[protein-PII] uridylyltransferase n=1 Tax=Magnetospirillum sp. UT-4 TaxID=2681467 RepID=UPI0013810057|nr:[protein-PII] uridylyltransferase [Magnetospirillum sp. UT-4]CAA7616346.1 Bifunctional uridylyltransferase/uridylyl-removing enzyme (Includes: (Protein-PII) uridylyltransferase; (Protein-PII)-UMP uridylyl-removing enzyme) [Magnetospirillum sp. UT-4]